MHFTPYLQTAPVYILSPYLSFPLISLLLTPLFSHCTFVPSSLSFLLPVPAQEALARMQGELQKRIEVRCPPEFFTLDFFLARYMSGLLPMTLLCWGSSRPTVFIPVAPSFATLVTLGLIVVLGAQPGLQLSIYPPLPAFSELYPQRRETRGEEKGGASYPALRKGGAERLGPSFSLHSHTITRGIPG